MAPRVLTVAPLPPEKLAYALARYSRSPDSIHDSLEWVRTHDSSKFLESFYFQYGHASIADLGHLAVCFEDISELAATEIQDEQLWDGQARSSRYQDFSKSGYITPPELDDTARKSYDDVASTLLSAYQQVQERVFEMLSERLLRPADMKPDAYRRNVTARAFDVARYLLFLGIPTGVGQVTSIRTLERQIRRLRASTFAEVRSIGDEAAAACAAPPACGLDDPAQRSEPIAATLAKYVSADWQEQQATADLRAWAQQNLTRVPNEPNTEPVTLLQPRHTLADTAATLLYSVTSHPFRPLYKHVCGWSEAQQREVLQVALQPRTRFDELPRAFRTQPYAFDMVMDIGAYRDMHRHRRCQQWRQDYSPQLGYVTPPAIEDAGLTGLFQNAIQQAHATSQQLPAAAAPYLLPFATRLRTLFKMDFAEAAYIIRLRSGVKGHFSYRLVAWQMREALCAAEPHLAHLVEATPHWEEDPLHR